MDILFQYSKRSEKFFVTHEDIRREFKEDIKKIVRNDHPEQVDYKRLKGKKSGYGRIAIRGYRILFTIIKSQVVIVSVIDAGSRGDIYK